jgi:hypothetical protein
MDTQTKMTDIDPDLKKIYTNVLREFKKSGLRFYLGGGIALTQYTHGHDEAQDLDIFCKASDSPKLLKILQDLGFKANVINDKWLSQAKLGEAKVDLIIASTNGVNVVDDSWAEHAKDAELFGEAIKVVGAEEVIWCKLYIQATDRLDGLDINHVLLNIGDKLDWQSLINRMEAHWEILFAALLNYRFVYPSEREKVPSWVMKDMVDRLKIQLQTPAPKAKICRGVLLDRVAYTPDVASGEFIL